ncbi:MAG: YdbC family protein [Chloroflexi bacterium]|nr:YdbC family protein [Chloroflexota bacterium]
MLIKWIVCCVPLTTRAEFAQAQCQWTPLSKLDGFLGQIGGWNSREPEQACILACWRDQAAYNAFMQNMHDAISDASAQHKTYDAIQVMLAEMVFPMTGKTAGLVAALPQGGVLRVADCIVSAERQAHFENVQRAVWTPAMAAADGMLGGAFSRVRAATPRYLVTSIWRDVAAHERYATIQAPILRQQADVEQDVQELRGYVVSLIPEWAVIPAQR